MEKKYIIKDTEYKLEMHDRDEGLDFSLYSFGENVVDGGVIDDFEGTEREALDIIERFLDHIKPKVNLESKNIIDISQVNEDVEFIEYKEIQLILKLNSLFEKNLDINKCNIFNELIDNPHKLSEFIQSVLEDTKGNDNYFRELQKCYKEVECYAIEKDLKEYIRENEIDPIYLGSTLQEKTVGDMAISTLYENILEKQNINTSNFYIETVETNLPGNYDILIVSNKGSKFEISVEVSDDRELIADDIFVIKQFIEMQNKIEKEMEFGKETVLSEDERKIMLKDFSRYISNMEIKEFPENTNELAIKYITKVKSNAINNNLEIQPNIKGIEKAIKEVIGDNIHINSISDVNRIQEKVTSAEDEKEKSNIKSYDEQEIE